VQDHDMIQINPEIAAERLKTLALLEKLRDERQRMGQKMDDIVVAIDQLLKEDRLSNPPPPFYADVLSAHSLRHPSAPQSSE
jgi:hypothetical protein